MMPRPGRELAIAEPTQFPAQRVRADRDAKLLPDPLRQIGQPPAYHAVYRRVRPGFNHGEQGMAMLVIQSRCCARRLAVDQPGHPVGVEPDDPVPNDLPANPADPRRLIAPHTVMDRRQCQQAPRLICIPRMPRKSAQIIGGEVGT